MATITVGLHPEAYGRNVFEALPNDDGAATGLIWREIEHLSKRAKLTLRQEEAVQLHFKGFTYEEISVALNVSRPTAYECLQKALSKMSGLKHKGLLTCVFEATGWDGVYYVLQGRKRRVLTK